MAQPPDPPPGNPNHEAPPEGAYCHLASPIAPSGDGAHACLCHEHKQCTKDADTGKMVIRESHTCRWYCFADACRCPVKCEDT